MPPAPPAGQALAPLPPSRSGGVQPPAPPRAEDLDEKIVDLEKKLQQEREKVLRADLKTQSEATNAAKVEVSISELQNSIRRDRRDSENQEARLKLETQNRELESRLAQERETWVATLKTQLSKRENQDKELESHFTVRIQEMERRWLEEKANWQKTLQSKEEEARNLRTLAEKLKGVDTDLTRVSMEKKTLEARLAEVTQERTDYYAKAQTSLEREKECIQLRADLTLSRQQETMMKERLERDMQVLRLSSKDREDRLLIDLDRLQRDLATVTERLRHEYEGEIKRIKREAETEMVKYKESATRAASDVHKIKGVSGALERQLAAARVQLQNFQKSEAQWDKAQERYKAEFVVLQRRWLEREKEIRAEIEEQSKLMFEAETSKLRLELEDRAKEHEANSLKEHEDMLAVLRGKEKELIEKLAKAEESRNISSQERITLGEDLKAVLQKLGALKAELAESMESLSAKEKECAEVSEDNLNNKRLAMAQAAEIKNLQDAFFTLRGQLSKDVHMAKMYMEEKDRMEKRISDLEKGPPPQSPNL